MAENFDVFGDSDMISMGQVEIKQSEKVKQFEDILQQRQPQTQQVPPHCWEVKYYQEYFDVTTLSVLQRLLKTLYPSKNKFFQSEAPDMYGPWWVATTLIFILIASGHFASFLQLENNEVFSVEKIVVAVVLVYSLVALVPFGCYCVLTNTGSRVALVELLSLYGYSYGVFIPAGLLCIIPSSILRWVITGLAAGWSGFLFVWNIRKQLEDLKGLSKYIVFILGVGGHFSVFLMCNLYFFEVSKDDILTQQQQGIRLLEDGFSFSCEGAWGLLFWLRRYWEINWNGPVWGISILNGIWVYFRLSLI